MNTTEVGHPKYVYNNDIQSVTEFKNDIQSVTEFNFVGLYLNSKLNWDTHINVIGKKISRAVGIIKKIATDFSPENPHFLV